MFHLSNQQQSWRDSGFRNIQVCVLAREIVHYLLWGGHDSTDQKTTFVKLVLHFLPQLKSHSLLVWTNFIFLISFISDVSECLHVGDVSKPFILQQEHGFAGLVMPRELTEGDRWHRTRRTGLTWGPTEWRHGSEWGLRNQSECGQISILLFTKLRDLVWATQSFCVTLLLITS